LKYIRMAEERVNVEVSICGGRLADRNAIAIAIVEILLWRKVDRDLNALLAGFLNASKNNALFDI